MPIKTQEELLALLKVGRIVGLALRHMQSSVRVGMTTEELDAIGGEFLGRHGVSPAPMMVYKFPGVACISINDEAAHGVPGKRSIREGDLVKIDLTGELDGYYADAAVTVAVPPVSPRKQKLCDCARSALNSAIGAARAGSRINRIGEAAESAARKCGFGVIRDLRGHGVGRGIHEAPSVPNVYMPGLKGQLTDGLVIAVEPHISMGSREIMTKSDGWTLSTTDGSLVANYEHTIVVTKGKPIVVTAA
jgi:methionyl aminopeptidase